MVERKTGFTLIEVLIAVGVLTALSFLIVYFLVEVSTSSLTNYKNFLASAELRQNAEAILSLRKKSFDSLLAGRYYLKFDNLLKDWVLVSFSPDQGDRYFIKEIIIKDAGQDLKKVTINIYPKDDYNLDSKSILTASLYIAKLNEDITQNCTNECFVLNQRECVDEGHFRVCGNYDDDACLEWSGIGLCPINRVCTEGRCLRIDLINDIDIIDIEPPPPPPPPPSSGGGGQKGGNKSGAGEG